VGCGEKPPFRCYHSAQQESLVRRIEVERLALNTHLDNLNTHRLTSRPTERSFNPSFVATSSPPSMRSQALGGSFSLAALRSTRASTRLIPASDHSAWRSRSLASANGHLTSVTGHERALTRRELAHRAVAADRATTELTGIPNDRRTSCGFLHWSTRPRCSGTHDAS
jgi:hypothetical protein